MQYQQNSTPGKPNKLDFKLDGVVPIDKNGFALFLNK